MHPLLTRQIKKYLPEDTTEHSDLEVFFGAIDRSYSDFEEKVKMIQHATTLSSQELFEANRMLRKKTKEQDKVLASLKNALASMKSQNEKSKETLVVKDSKVMAENIEQQANKIVKINKEKDKLLKNLASQNESLNNYAHMVSHDLRSPIRNMHSLMSWVLEEDGRQLAPSSKSNIELIFQSLEKMDRLIDGILIHATIDNKEERKEQIDMGQLLKSLIEQQLLADNITIKVQDKMPVLEINRYRMEQLFLNLLSNSIRAVSAKEKGIVEVDFLEMKDGLRFSVRDNGVGIPEHHQKTIFDMFKKIDNDSRTTGIGLALVKKIINFYGGDIWISSKENKGTTIFFTLNNY